MYITGPQLSLGYTEKKKLNFEKFKLIKEKDTSKLEIL